MSDSDVREVPVLLLEAGAALEEHHGPDPPHLDADGAGDLGVLAHYLKLEAKARLPEDQGQKQRYEHRDNQTHVETPTGEPW
jgi:hypothetical protein